MARDKPRTRKAYDPQRKIIALEAPNYGDPKCCGPFQRGVPGSDQYGGCFASCCDNLCPPPGCCTTVNVYFECGSGYDPVEFPDGCVRPYECETGEAGMLGTGMLGIASFRFEEMKADDPTMPEMPIFSNKIIQSDDGQFVFALANSCSIPCAEVAVTLTSSDLCCFDIDAGVIYAVGSGTVSATIDPTTYDDCGALTPFINGSPNTTVVNDGDIIAVTVLPVDGECCACCLTRVENPCDSLTAWVLKDGKIVMNNTAIQRRLTRIKRRKLKLKRGKK